MDLTVWQLLEIGGLPLWITLFMSVLALAVGAERIWALRGFVARARQLTETVRRCLGRGAVAEARTACERSRSPLADVFLVGFERHGRSSAADVEAAVDRERQRMLLDLRARLWMLGTIGAVAPFVGLYGTVRGIMSAFRTIAEKGGGGFNTVSEGISEALIATAAGIAVAVEAVVIYNYLSQRMARLAIEVRLLVEEFLEALRGGGPPETAAPRPAEGGEHGARQAP